MCFKEGNFESTSLNLGEAFSKAFINLLFIDLFSDLKTFSKIFSFGFLLFNIDFFSSAVGTFTF